MSALLLQLLLLSAQALVSAAPPPYALVFSAGFTDGVTLQSAPAAAAVYGFSYAPAGVVASITVTLTSLNTGAVAARVSASPADAGAGTACDAGCYDLGYLSGVGTTSCCNAPTCPIGCAFGGVTPSLAACNAQCANATGCSYAVPGTAVAVDMCEDCLAGCPAKGECEAGCALRFAAAGAPAAWKALLPPQQAGAGEFTITATCDNCLAGAAPARTLARVRFGTVVCSYMPLLLLSLSPLTTQLPLTDLPIPPPRRQNIARLQRTE